MGMTTPEMWATQGSRTPDCGRTRWVHNEAELSTVLSTHHPQGFSRATCDYVVCPQS
jgi:hypothetical protein